jgi:hypothetical protein
VKLFVTGIPAEEPHAWKTKGEKGEVVNPVSGEEVRDVLNQSLRDHAPHVTGHVMEVDRKDERKSFAFAELSDEQTASELMLLSKKRKVNLRGVRLILELSDYNTTQVSSLCGNGTSHAVKGGAWLDDWAAGGRGSGRGGGGKGKDGNNNTNSNSNSNSKAKDGDSKDKDGSGWWASRERKNGRDRRGPKA